MAKPNPLGTIERYKSPVLELDTKAEAIANLETALACLEAARCGAWSYQLESSITSVGKALDMARL